jgi:hypothetical protein
VGIHPKSAVMKAGKVRTVCMTWQGMSLNGRAVCSNPILMMQRMAAI